MIRSPLISALVAVAILFLVGGAFAQAPAPAYGDYGSAASGNWSSAATWKAWTGGAFDSTVTGAPGSSKQVFILTGTIVTYDLASQNCKNLIVQSGATFKSDSTIPCPTGSLMPLKINGPTVWVDGNLGGGPNDALVLETKYNGTVTLVGSGKVDLAQVRPNSGQSGTMAFVFAMNANINYAGSDGSGGAGIYTQRGTQTSATITINAGDTVNFAVNSSFMINSTPGLNGLMNTILNVNGVVNDSGTVVLADSSTAMAALNIGSTGTLKIRGSSVTEYLNGGDTATVTVDGTYEHALNGGVIPTATWHTGSTCLISGSTTLGPTNANQDFHNLTVDCPGLTQPSYPCHFDMQNNTIMGNLTFHDTHGKFFALTGYEVPGGPKTITVNGDFVMDSTSDSVVVDDYSSSHAAETVNLVVKGNMSCTGFFALTYGSAHNFINLYLHGNLSIESGMSFCSHSSTQDSVYFAGSGVQTYVAGQGGAANRSHVNFAALGGTTVDADTSRFEGGSSAFALMPGATLKTAHPAGLNGNLVLGGGTILSEAANYVFDGTLPQITGSLMPDTVNNFLIDNVAGVTPDTALTVNGTLLVNGLLIIRYGITSNDTAIVNGTYRHAMDGGIIPRATWNTGSTCLITGTSANNPTGANQNFYNFTVDCDSLTQPAVPIHFDMQNNTIAGNLTFHNTNGQYIALTGFDTPGPKTITVDGNFSLDSTSSFVAVDDYSSSHPVESVGLIVKGNLLTMGSFGMTVGSAHNLINLMLHGNLTLEAGSSFFSHSGTQDSLFFAGTSVQTYRAGVLSNGNRINTLVRSGSILDMDTSDFQGTNSTFTLDSGATVKTGHPSGLNGNLTIGGGTNLSGNANYVFDGVIRQVTGTLLPTSVNSLVVNDSLGIELSGPIAINGLLNLARGNLLLDTNHVVAASISGGTSSSYLSTDSSYSYLKIPKVGSSTILFPVGTQAEGYSPVWVTNSGTADTFRVSAAVDTNRAPYGGRVNTKWNITKSTAGAASCTLQFGWMSSAEDTAFAANRQGEAKIYLLTDTANTEAGTGAYTQQLKSRPFTVSRGGITKLGTFAVGNFTTTGIDGLQAVPIEFKLYQNYPNPFNPTTKIEFTVAKKGLTSLTVYNVLGQRVGTLFSANAQPGTIYSADFNGGAFASGVYFSVLENNGERQIHKMVLMK